MHTCDITILAVRLPTTRLLLVRNRRALPVRSRINRLLGPLVLLLFDPQTHPLGQGAIRPLDPRVLLARDDSFACGARLGARDLVFVEGL